MEKCMGMVRILRPDWQGGTNIDGMPCANDAIIISIIIIIILGKRQSERIRDPLSSPQSVYFPPPLSAYGVLCDHLPSIHSLTCIRCAVAGPWSLRPDP